MAPATCPLCHGKISLNRNTPYCANCGWNRDVVAAQLRTGIKFLPFSMAIFLAFGYFVVFRRMRHFDTFALGLFLGLPFVMMMVSNLAMRRTLSKLEQLPSPPTRPIGAGTDASSGASEDAENSAVTVPSPEYQTLLRTSRPREVQMARRGLFNIGVVMLVVVGFGAILGINIYATWARNLSFAFFTTKDWALVGLAAFIVLIPFAMWRSQVRECDLLENGEIALAKVTRQWSNKNNSSIQYEFKDFQGQTHQEVGFDYTGKLYEGMSVPVFYDRDNSKRQIASCATLHEVVT